MDLWSNADTPHKVIIRRYRLLQVHYRSARFLVTRNQLIFVANSTDALPAATVIALDNHRIADLLSDAAQVK